ncbi:MAG: hypothetical protein ACRDK4_05870 [Solirubrobacteraceae bacterium]
MGVASAYWTTAGQSNVSANLATLSAPTIESARTGAESVELEWSPIAAPAAGAVEYYVSRDGAAASAGCPGSSSLSSETSCTDTNVPVGSHIYTVTAVWRSWTASGVERTVSVAYGPATHLVLEAASTTPLAGERDSLTVTAKDAGNHTVGTYIGAHDLAFEGAGESASGATPVVVDASGVEQSFGEATEIDFNEGKATVSSADNGVMKLYRAEAAHIKVKEGALNNGTGLAVTVKAATSTKRFTLSASSEPTAGTAFSAALTATDEWGNTTAGYAGSKSIAWSGPSNSPSGKAPTYPATVSFTAGVGTASIKLYDAQSTTLKALEGSIQGTSALLSVKPGAAKKFNVPTPAEQRAAVAFNMTLTAIDEWGNQAKSYVGTKTLVLSGPASSPAGQVPEYPATATSVTFTEGVGTSSAIKLSDAQSTTLKAKEGTRIEGTSGTFVVSAGEPERLAWSHPEVTAGTLEGGSCPFACKTTSIGNNKKFKARLSITDKYGNVVTGLGVARKVKVEKTSGEGTLLGATGLTIPASGLAESASTFEYTSPTSGTSEAVLRLKPEGEGATYTEAEAHVKY